MSHSPLCSTKRLVACTQAVEKPVSKVEVTCSTSTTQADAAVHLHLDVADDDLHALGVGEDALPTLADFLPAFQQLPARMHALDPVGVQPDRFHSLQVEAVHGGVEPLVGGQDFLFRFHGRLVGGGFG